MQISNSSSLYYGQLGLQRSQTNLDQASAEVASATAASQNASSPASSGVYGDDIQDGLIHAKQSELQAQANTKVIAAADGMLGTLIDITV